MSSTRSWLATPRAGSAPSAPSSSLLFCATIGVTLWRYDRREDALPATRSCTATPSATSQTAKEALLDRALLVTAALAAAAAERRASWPQSQRRFQAAIAARAAATCEPRARTRRRFDAALRRHAR